MGIDNIRHTQLAKYSAFAQDLRTGDWHTVEVVLGFSEQDDANDIRCLGIADRFISRRGYHVDTIELVEVRWNTIDYNELFETGELHTEDSK